MTHTLPALPYPTTALEPHLSATTLEIHHGKHHQAYVTNLNALIAGTPLADASLEEAIAAAAASPEMTGIFNNAAQVWNHTFYWNSLAPKGGGEPQGALLEAIVKKFGSFQGFAEAFKKAALGQFGSGWAWLVANKEGDVSIVTTGNAHTPLTQAGVTPLLTCDVWEHAYYIDYQNRRADYAMVFLDHLANWRFAEAQYAGRAV